jgi:hypothetical protein
MACYFFNMTMSMSFIHKKSSSIVINVLFAIPLVFNVAIVYTYVIVGEYRLLVS